MTGPDVKRPGPLYVVVGLVLLVGGAALAVVSAAGHGETAAGLFIAAAVAGAVFLFSGIRLGRRQSPQRPR